MVVALLVGVGALGLPLVPLEPPPQPVKLGFPFSPAPDGPVTHPKAAAPTRIVFIAQSSRF